MSLVVFVLSKLATLLCSFELNLPLFLFSFFLNRLLALEGVNLWKSGLMTLSTTSGSAVKVVMEVWMNWRLEIIFPFIAYCARQECPCRMIYIKQFCRTGFFLRGAIFLLLSYCLVWVHNTSLALMTKFTYNASEMTHEGESSTALKVHCFINVHEVPLGFLFL